MSIYVRVINPRSYSAKFDDGGQCVTLVDGNVTVSVHDATREQIAEAISCGGQASFVPSERGDFYILDVSVAGMRVSYYCHDLALLWEVGAGQVLAAA